MTYFHSNEPSDQDSPHWIGGEYEQPHEQANSIYYEELASNVLDTINTRMKSGVIWMDSESGKTDHRKLVDHIQKNAHPEKKRNAFYDGLNVVERQTHKFLKRAQKDEAALGALLKNWTPDLLVNVEDEKSSAALSAVRIFWRAAARVTYRAHYNTQLETVFMREADEALQSILTNDSDGAEDARAFLVDNAHKNAHKRVLHFNRESEQIAIKKSKYKSSNNPKNNDYSGTIKDKYVQEKRRQKDGYGR